MLKTKILSLLSIVLLSTSLNAKEINEITFDKEYKPEIKTAVLETTVDLIIFYKEKQRNPTIEEFKEIATTKNCKIENKQIKINDKKWSERTNCLGESIKININSESRKLDDSKDKSSDNQYNSIIVDFNQSLKNNPNDYIYCMIKLNNGRLENNVHCSSHKYLNRKQFI